MNDVTTLTVTLVVMAFCLGWAFSWATIRGQVKILETALSLKIEEIEGLDWALEQEKDKATQYKKTLVSIRDSSKESLYADSAQLQRRAATGLNWTPR